MSAKVGLDKMASPCLDEGMTQTLIPGQPIALVAKSAGTLTGFTAMLDATDATGLHLTAANGNPFTVPHASVVRVAQAPMLVEVFAKEQRKALRAK